jgi:hypothetical protein
MKIAPSNNLFDMDFCEVIANCNQEFTEALAEVNSNFCKFSVARLPQNNETT